MSSKKRTKDDIYKQSVSLYVCFVRVCVLFLIVCEYVQDLPFKNAAMSRNAGDRTGKRQRGFKSMIASENYDLLPVSEPTCNRFYTRFILGGFEIAML